MPLLSKLIPFRDYAYAAAAVAVVIWYNVHVHNLEVHYAAQQVAAVREAVTDASAQALAAAKAAAEAKEREYSIQLSQVEDTYESQLKSSDAQHVADLSRLRQLEASSLGNPDALLQGAGGAGSSPNSGGSSLVGLGYVSEELASALRDARADLGKCYDERSAVK